MMNTQWIDDRYINLLSFKLRNFKRKSEGLYNFSCPFCGDSKTDSSRARGFMYFRKGKYRYYCHNCHITGIDTEKLVKHLDPGMHGEYLKERIANYYQNQPKAPVQIFAEKMKTPKFVKDTPLNELQKISQLAPDHYAKQFIVNRRLPTTSHHRLFFAPKFKTWISKIDSSAFETIEHDEPRLVIPFVDKDGNLFGVQGRSFKPNAKLRYITIMFDKDKPKLYGMDRVDLRRKIPCLEGPLDSLFVPNALASAGSDITSNLDVVSTDKSNFIVVYDNEKRNKDTVAKIERAINNNYPVCIWPESIQQKDVNDMILAGLSVDYVVETIFSRTFQGPRATIELMKWKRV